MRCSQLSGGQRRRLDVALALIGDPELLFFDEPTTVFDPSAPPVEHGPGSGRCPPAPGRSSLRSSRPVKKEDRAHRMEDGGEATSDRCRVAYA